jgi:predicted ATPase
MTQRDLALATGYSIGQICRFEQNQCVPDLPTLTARFLPALVPASDTATAERLLALADSARAAQRGGQRRQPITILAPLELGVGHAPALELPALPLPPTPLLGREREAAQVCALLRQATVRLLTLTGAPGMGKTRLGLQVAADLHTAFEDGVVVVALAPISDPALVLSTIAQALGVQERAGQTVLDSLKGLLRERHLLLLLDNFEQVISAAPLVGELLAAAPGLKVLATSRRPLHLSGEQEFVVAPLALPPRGRDAQASACIATLTQYAAVQLFIARAQAVKGDFGVTDATAAAIVEICHRLDGLPLAIELAAARIKLFPPQALLTRLERRLQLLTTGAQDLPARQQTLRTTIDWSYHLLDVGTQRLFACLGVFVGGCTLEAAEAVCELRIQNEALRIGAAPGQFSMFNSQFSILDGLASLVDQSLVQQAEGLDGEPRFVLLETIREYTLEQLEASGEAETLQRRHATYYLAMAEAAAPQLQQPNQVWWMERLEQEHDNLRAVLLWSSTPSGSAETGLRLAGSLWRFWMRRGYVSEGRQWLERVLICRHHAAASVQAHVLYGAGFLAGFQRDDQQAAAYYEASLSLCREQDDIQGSAYALFGLGQVAYNQGNATGAMAWYEESLALFSKVDDRWGRTWPLTRLGSLARDQGNYPCAVALYTESLTLYRELGDKGGIAAMLRHLGNLAFLQGHTTQAEALLAESLSLFQEMGDKLGIATSLTYLGEMARFQGHYLRAALLYTESLELYRNVGDRSSIAAVLHNLGHVALQQGDEESANKLIAESLILSQELGDKLLLGGCLVGLAGVISIQGHPEQAVRLFGAAETLFEGAGGNVYPVDRAEYDRTLAAIRARLDEATFAQAWAEGQALTLEQAIAYALNGDN